jgi:drug/metabolite transporter (DMT)-like permease
VPSRLFSFFSADKTSTRKGQLIKLAATLSMAIMAIGVKYAFEQGASLVETLLLRTSLALPWILLWVFATGKGLKALIPNSWRAQTSRALLGLTSVSLAFYTISLLPLAEATVILFLSPLFAALLAALLLKEKLHLKQIVAIFAGLLGVVIVAQPGGNSLPLYGVAVGLTGALFMGLVSVLLRTIAHKESAITTTFCLTITVSVAYGVLYPWFHTDISSQVFLVLAISAFFGFIGQMLMTLSFRYADVADLVAMDFTNIIWVGLLGYILWQVIPPVPTWIGAAIIVVGSFLVMRNK